MLYVGPPFFVTILDLYFAWDINIINDFIILTKFPSLRVSSKHCNDLPAITSRDRHGDMTQLEGKLKRINAVVGRIKIHLDQLSFRLAVIMYQVSMCK